MSSARLDVWAQAQIVAYAKAGLRPNAIAGKVTKTDGKIPRLRSVQKTIAKAKKYPHWRGGGRGGGPGRPSMIGEAERRQLMELVLQERGSALVTIRYCQQRIPTLRKVSRWAVARALRAAGYHWLRRRRKRWVAPAHVAPRLRFARWALRQPAPVLRTFAFMDGTTYYLARGPSEEPEKQRGRLGAYVWRMSTAADGLYNDNVGPSLYAAKQGRPVKVWGFLGNGHLCIYVLDAHGKNGTKHMNGALVRWMLERYGKQWVARCWPRRPSVVRVVMDYEKCLRQDETTKCFLANGLTPLGRFPRSSQDLNAIENV